MNFPKKKYVFYSLWAISIFFSAYAKAGYSGFSKHISLQVFDDQQKESTDSTKERSSEFINKLTKHEIIIHRKKTSYKFKYSGRIQTRFDLSKINEEDAETKTKLYLRRVRFKSDGYIFGPKLSYKLEVDLLGVQILDAVIKWNFIQNFVIWVGQTKLRGNRERVISSQNLQFVDRSLLNSKFTLDRDIGFWLMHHTNVGRGVIREAISVSKGEGRSIFKDSPQPVINGLDYTARIEYLPFGFFKNKGDYKGGDLEREPTPKLSIGLTYDYNEKAAKTNGQKGSVVGNLADLQSWFADLMFKYKGYSLMAEYVNRRVLSSQEYVLVHEDIVSQYYTGNAFNIQAGYLFKRNYEIAGRYTIIRPNEISAYSDLT